MPTSRLYAALAYAGSVPFVVCAVSPLVGVDSLGVLGPVDYIAASYALVIVSFMAGAHWGTYLYKQAASPLNLFIASNLITLVVWFTFLLSDTPGPTLVASILAFGALLLIDWRLYQADLLTQPYFVMRRNVTAIVTIALLVTVIGT
ncbi:MAG: DUF3429 domain-containing protein [Gammaproteobacteria bacterium]|nr:DUF3429 domain-containing protein [Gammaproteobacteria bacterium]